MFEQCGVVCRGTLVMAAWTEPLEQRCAMLTVAIRSSLKTPHLLFGPFSLDFPTFL